MSDERSVWRYCAIAPIHTDWTFDDEVRLPFHFAADVAIRAAPVWLKASDSFSGMTTARQLRALLAAYAVCADYYDTSPAEADPRASAEEPLSREDFAMLSIQRATQACWLARPSALVCESAIHARFEKPDDRWTVITSAALPMPTVREGEEAVRSTVKDLDSARSLYGAICSLEVGSLKRAVATLWTALTARTPEVRYLVLWVALEALFGPQNPGEATHRLSERLALFLHGPGAEARREYESAKRAYTTRSRVVHGRELRKKHLSYNADAWTEAALRRILLDRALRRSSAIRQSVRCQEAVARPAIEARGTLRGGFPGRARWKRRVHFV